MHYFFRYILRLCIATWLLLAAVNVTFGSSPYDEIIYKNAEEAMARIDGYLIALQNYPSATGNIIVYGAIDGKLGEVEAHINQLPHYIENFRRFNKGRIAYVNGGFRDKATVVLWIVPPGADLPRPTPYHTSKDVKLKGNLRKSFSICAADDSSKRLNLPWLKNF